MGPGFLILRSFLYTTRSHTYTETQTFLSIHPSAVITCPFKRGTANADLKVTRNFLAILLHHVGDGAVGAVLRYIHGHGRIPTRTGSPAQRHSMRCISFRQPTQQQLLHRCGLTLHSHTRASTRGGAYVSSRSRQRRRYCGRLYVSTTTAVLRRCGCGIAGTGAFVDPPCVAAPPVRPSPGVSESLSCNPLMIAARPPHTHRERPFFSLLQQQPQAAAVATKAAVAAGGG